ncbi:MAG: hypothetical protein ABFS10_02820, partial [Bacteroidota bacterium]
MKQPLFFLALIFTSCSFFRQEAVEIYVSPNGNDNNSGTIDSPLVTAEAARDRARETGPGKARTIYFREGIYRFSKPLELGEKDTGEKGKPVVYTAYENEKVIFSGSRKLELNWEKLNDSIYVASADFPLEEGFSPRSIYINGKAAPLARYP